MNILALWCRRFFLQHTLSLRPFGTIAYDFWSCLLTVCEYMQGFSTFQTVHAALQYLYNQQALAKGDRAPDQVSHTSVLIQCTVFVRDRSGIFITRLCLAGQHSRSVCHLQYRRSGVTGQL